jgi:hypothetical protein
MIGYRMTTRNSNVSLDIPIRVCLPPIWITAFQPFQPMYCYKARIRVDRAQINIKSIKRDILVEL